MLVGGLFLVWLFARFLFGLLSVVRLFIVDCLIVVVGLVIVWIGFAFYVFWMLVVLVLAVLLALVIYFFVGCLTSLLCVLILFALRFII